MDEVEELINDTYDAVSWIRERISPFVVKSDSKSNNLVTESDASSGKHSKWNIGAGITADDDPENIIPMERVSTGEKPKSKPPCNVNAIDDADDEVAALAVVYSSLGRSFPRPVWRVGGIVRGVLYEDLRPIRRMSKELLDEYREGWRPTIRELEELQRVRYGNFRKYPELDVFLSMGRVERPDRPDVSDMALFDVE